MNEKPVQPVVISRSSPEFELTITGKHKLLDIIQGKLTSSLLDAELHPDHSIRILIGDVVGDPVPEFDKALDSFKEASVIEYLTNQKQVRQTLEEQLAGDWAIQESGRFVPKDAWMYAKIVGLFLEGPRLAKSAASATNPFLAKANPALLAKLAQNADTEQTRTKFKVLMEIDWDEEHSQRVAAFRDGTFLKWNIEP